MGSTTLMNKEAEGTVSHATAPCSRIYISKLNLKMGQPPPSHWTRSKKYTNSITSKVNISYVIKMQRI